MDERSESEAFEPWFKRIEDGDGEIPAPQSIADPGWSEYVQRHSIAWAAWQERARRPEPNHGPEALTTAGLLSSLEADTLTGTQRAALAAMIRGRAAAPVAFADRANLQAVADSADGDVPLVAWRDQGVAGDYHYDVPLYTITEAPGGEAGAMPDAQGGEPA